MAPLNKVVLVPELDRIRMVFGHRPPGLLRRDTSLDPQWFISLSTEKTFKLHVDVEDVVFKFECFGFMFSELRQNYERIAEARVVSMMQDIEFVFRSEWKRPALPGEVRAHYNQTIRHLGQLSDIPLEATDAGLSLVGLIWYSGGDDERGERQAIYHDTDETLTVPNFTNESEKIEKLRSVGTVVGINGLESWYAEMHAWINND